MFAWKNFDNLDKLFIIWAFFLQIALTVHYAIRKPFFESYTIRFGWVVYALGIPAAVIRIILFRGGKSWSFWLGEFLSHPVSSPVSRLFACIPKRLVKESILIFDTRIA